MSKLQLRMIAAITLLGSFGLSGCQYRSKKDTYYLVANNLKLPYWKTVKDGFMKAATQYGVTGYVAGPDNFDPKAELESFTKAASYHPAGIIVSVGDASLMRDEINSAVAAGTPVLTIDSDAPLSNRLYFIGTNNVAVGRLGGQRLVDKLHGKGNVVFYTITGQPNLDERMKGYKDVLADHPGIKIVDTFDTKGDAGIAFDQTEVYMAKSGGDKVDAFVALESAAGKSIAEVIKRDKGVDRTLIAMDVDEDTLNLIKDGSVDSAISQKPYTMGYVGLQALDEIHHNKPAGGFRNNYAVDPFAPFPSFVDTGTSLIDKVNVDQYLGASQAAQQ